MGNENRTGYGQPITLRRYSLPNVKGDGWAIFVIGSDGYFSVCSDYGNYAFIWTHAGREFRSFIAGLEWDYCGGKLASGRELEYDGERTYANVRDCILRARRDGWAKEKAREEWDLLGTYERLSGKVDLARWIDATSLFDASELISYRSVPRQIEAFCKVVLPRFQQLLRDELAAEAAPSQPAEAANGR